MKKIACYILLGLTCFIFPSAAFAESTTKGFTISPPFQEVVVSENQVKTSFSVEITNNSSFSQTLRLSIFDFGTLDESGGVAFLGSKPSDWQKKYGLASWVSLEKDSVIIAPMSSEKIHVMIDNKESLSPGGHYAGLMATLVRDAQGEKNIVGINQVFTSLIFAKKIGGEKYDLLLNRTDLDRFYALTMPDEVKLRFQNRGNVHVVPRGVITVRDYFNRIVAQGTINPESSIITPESFRVYPVMVRAVSPAFVPGRYTVMVQYRYDGKDDFSELQYTTYFFGQLNIVLGLVIVCLLFVFIVKHRHKDKAKKIPL